MGFEETYLTEIDRQTWNVFSRMNNVTQLDLASLHGIWEAEFVRQNPDQLFPAVTDLRLLGWMHRGLAKAIITSLNTSKLRSLKLDYLQDEGALPDGSPLSYETAVEYAHHARRTDTSDLVGDELFQRQEVGKACIFPGPMWLPLRLLSACPLDSLTHLQVKVAPFHMYIDLRNYYSLFHEMANLMLKVRESLRNLVIVFGEFPSLYKEHRSRLRPGVARISMDPRQREEQEIRPWCIRMAAAFLDQSLAALKERPFPYLRNINFEGFRILEMASPQEAAAAGLASTFQFIRDCSFTDVNFIETSSVDFREAFIGFDCEKDSEEEEDEEEEDEEDLEENWYLLETS